MNKYELQITSQFKNDLKLAKKRNLDMSVLEKVVDILLKGDQLAPKYCDHCLTGNYMGFRECHLKSDWLLIYSINNDKLILTASRTGTHADLF